MVTWPATSRECEQGFAVVEMFVIDNDCTWRRSVHHGSSTVVALSFSRSLVFGVFVIQVLGFE